MNTGLPSNFPQLPPGLTEADMIDMIDGSLPPERESIAIAALKADPGLGLLIKRMRVDRSELAVLGATRLAAPAGMLEAIEAKLDREALGQLVAESEEFAAPIPISTVVPTRPNIFTTLAEGVWGRRLATAASLAIVGGIGFIAVREVTRSWPAAPQSTPIATTNPKPSDAGTTDPSGRSAVEVATNDHSDTDVLEHAAPSPEAVAVAAKGAADPEHPTATMLAASELTLAEALRLAEAGRLVVTVRSTNLEGSLRHLQELSRTSDRAVRWRAYELNSLPTELAALSSPLPDELVPDGGPARPGQPFNPPTFASDDPTGPRPPMVRPRESELPRLSTGHVMVRALRVVQTESSTRALDDLLRDIAVNKSHRAQFRVLPEQAALRSPPGVDAESVLWWTRGASNWNKRISVPVIVETAE